MKNTVTLFVLCFSILNVLQAQDVGEYKLEVKNVSFETLPTLHSFVFGTVGNKVLLIGGRVDGLHRRQPWATFWESENNTSAYVIDIEEQQVWEKNLSELPPNLYEQLQSTNMEFVQVENDLYISGGYGYSATAQDHITYPFLTIVKLEECINAIINGEAISPYFSQLEDERMRVTGGQMGYLDGIFYLVGGQKFMGRYNPMGPDHGPGFIQEYTDAIRKFSITYDNENYAIENYQSIIDSAQLHRRDYNMLPQIFPNGQAGFTAFSGVFQHEVDLPWLNTVNIHSDSFEVNNDFNQYLSQYHSAKAAIYSSEHNEMYNLFFGGISQYFIDNEGDLIRDENVPFVTTISSITRFNDGQMLEEKIGDMPALLGAGAEFFLNQNLFIENDIIQYDSFQDDTIRLGYIFGGIESSQANIFFINNGEESTASNQLFEVLLTKTVNSTINIDQQIEEIKIYPNPSSKKKDAKIELSLTTKANIQIDLFDNKGVMMNTILKSRKLSPGLYQYDIPTKNLTAGVYHIRVKVNDGFISKKIVVK